MGQNCPHTWECQSLDGQCPECARCPTGGSVMRYTHDSFRETSGPLIELSHSSWSSNSSLESVHEGKPYRPLFLGFLHPRNLSIKEGTGKMFQTDSPLTCPDSPADLPCLYVEQKKAELEEDGWKEKQASTRRKPVLPTIQVAQTD